MADARALFVGACTRTSARITVVSDASARVAHLAWSDREQGGEQLLSLPLEEAPPSGGAPSSSRSCPSLMMPRPLEMVLVNR